MTDPVSQLYETATYCKSGDELRPTLVGLPDFTTQTVCPEEGDPEIVTNAYPDGWYIRIMFDELLDPSIEALTPIIDSDTGEETGAFTGSIAAANPVTLECQSVVNDAFVQVDYDGYYSPSGNRITWPVGPSLVIKPNDPTLIATNRQCRVTINANAIRDKQGETVPSDQLGPFEFATAPITALFSDPSDSFDDEEPTEVDAAYLYNSNFYWQFNTDVQVSSFCQDTDFGGSFPDGAGIEYGAGLCDEGTESFTLTPPVSPADAGGFWGSCNVSGDFCSTVADCTDPADERCDSSYAYTYNGLAADDEIGIGYLTPLQTETEYSFSLAPGTVLRDRCGAETTIAALDPDREDLFTINFVTNELDLAGFNIATGEIPRPVKKQYIEFNQIIDPTTLEAGEYSITPAPADFELGQSTGAEIIIGGNYALGTAYTFTLNAGATVSDYYGATYTTEEATTITWTTQDALDLVSSSPSSSGTIQKIMTQQLVGVTLTWNASMDIATLTADEFTFVNATTGADVTALSTFRMGNGSGAAGQNCSTTASGCQFRMRADLQEGSYTFTLKAGATVSDKLGNVYTQAEDLVINFAVADVEPAAQCL